MTRTTLALALLAGAPAALAADVQITAATRTVEAQAIGYDWEFYGGDNDTQTSDAPLGDFDATAFVDVQEWYGGQVGTGTAIIDSTVSADEIIASFDLFAACDNVGVFQADAYAIGTIDVDFAVVNTVRATVSFEAFCYDDYAWAFANLRNTGSLQQVLSLTIFGDDDGGVNLTTWLQPGTYELTGEGNAFAFGTYGTFDDAPTLLNIVVRFYDAADYNTDGKVTAADRTAFLAAYNAGSPAADFDGNGIVTIQDRRGFLRAYRAATS